MMKACITHVQMAAFLNPSLGRRKHILKHRVSRRALLLIGRGSGYICWEHSKAPIQTHWGTGWDIEQQSDWSVGLRIRNSPLRNLGIIHFQFGPSQDLCWTLVQDDKLEFHTRQTPTLGSLDLTPHGFSCCVSWSVPGQENKQLQGQDCVPDITLGVQCSISQMTVVAMSFSEGETETQRNKAVSPRSASY